MSVACRTRHARRVLFQTAFDAMVHGAGEGTNSAIVHQRVISIARLARHARGVLFQRAHVATAHGTRFSADSTRVNKSVRFYVVRTARSARQTSGVKLKVTFRAMVHAARFGADGARVHQSVRVGARFAGVARQINGITFRAIIHVANKRCRRSRGGGCCRRFSSARH